MSRVVLDARNARMGGGLNLVGELFPRLERELDTRRHTVSRLEGPTRDLRLRLNRRRDLLLADAILHVGNRATPSGAAKVVCVQDRLLLQRTKDEPARTRVRRELLKLAIFSARHLIVPTAAMVDPLREFVRKLRKRRAVEVSSIPHGRPNWSPPVDRMMSDEIRLFLPSYVAVNKNFEMLASLLKISRSSLSVRLTLTATGKELLPGGSLESVFEEVLDLVDFVGPVARSKLPELFNAHDVMLFPSRVEAFGIPLVEAMAMNMPIIVTDADWSREICNTSALYADPSDQNTWLSLLQSVASEGWRRNPAGLRRVQHFDWDESSRRYADIIEGVLE